MTLWYRIPPISATPGRASWVMRFDQLSTAYSRLPANAPRPAVMVVARPNPTSNRFAIVQFFIVPHTGPVNPMR